MGVSLCSLHESNVFDVRAVLGMDACHIFLQGVLAVIALIGCVIVVVVTRACTGYWVRATLCSVVITALLGVGFSSQLLHRSPQIWF